MKRRIVFRKKKQNKLGMFLVMLVVFMLLLVVSINSFELKKTQVKYEEKAEKLKVEIEKEHARAYELADFRKYTQTKKYVEEIAKDKLGLIYENEIIFRIED